MLLALLITAVLNPFAPPQPYGPGHRGVDFAASVGAPVLAPVSGWISYVGRINGVATITLTSGSKKVTVQPVQGQVKLGQVVKTGEVIGVVQRANYHCTACIHLGIRDNGKYIDPLMFTRQQLLPVGRSVWVDVQ